MSSVVLTGPAGDLGRRVLDLLSGDPAVDRVLAIDRSELVAPPHGVHTVRGDLADLDLKALFEGADVVVHLASSDQALDRSTTVDDVEVARRVLDAAGSCGVDHVVVRSSAVVYGAWPNNPVPLTEEAPLRPDPALPWATERAEIERLVAEWREEHPGSTATVLRPTVTVGESSSNRLAEAFRATAVIRAGADDDPPFQFLHLDDLAAAVHLACRARVDGPVNVAPDGWVPGETLRALAGGAPRLRLPETVATRVAAWRWRWRLAPTPPGLVPYTVHSWVVANDRLVDLGWRPGHTNEEAYVAGHAAGPLAELSPRRRQEIALAVVGVGFAAVLAGAVAALRGRRRRSRHRSR